MPQRRIMYEIKFVGSRDKVDEKDEYYETSHKPDDG
jgi:hypothetical protein